jgi:hypothetical protein
MFKAKERSNLNPRSHMPRRLPSGVDVRCTNGHAESWNWSFFPQLSEIPLSTVAIRKDIHPDQKHIELHDQQQRTGNAEGLVLTLLKYWRQEERMQILAVGRDLHIFNVWLLCFWYDTSLKDVLPRNDMLQGKIHDQKSRIWILIWCVEWNSAPPKSLMSLNEVSSAMRIIICQRNFSLLCPSKKLRNLLRHYVMRENAGTRGMGWWGDQLLNNATHAADEEVSCWITPLMLLMGRSAAE